MEEESGQAIEFGGTELLREELEEELAEYAEMIEMFKSRPWKKFTKLVRGEQEKMVMFYDNAQTEKQFWWNQGRRQCSQKIFDFKDPGSLVAGIIKSFKDGMKAVGE